MFEFVLGLIIGVVIGGSGSAFVLLSIFDRKEEKEEKDDG